MKAKRKRLLSWLLAVALMVQMVPIEALAVSDDPIIPTAEDGTPLEIISDGRADDAYIIGEIEGQRDESEKHFRLSDGSFTAVSYGVPVHYEQDGQWVDIDNTLEPVTLYDGTETYQTINGDSVQAFSGTLSDGTILSTASGDSSIIMKLWDGAAEEVPMDEPAGDPAEETAAESEEPAELEEGTQPGEDVQSEESAASETSAEVESTTETASFGNQKNVGEDTEAGAEVLPNETEDPEQEEPVEELQEEPAEPEPEETEAPEQENPVEELQEEPALPEFNRDATAEILNQETSMAAAEETEIHRSRTDVIPDTLSSSVLYADVYPGVDLQYDLFSYNIKESIILKEPMDQVSAIDGNADETPDTTACPYRYSFLLEFTDLSPSLLEDGSIQLENDDGQLVYEIPAPYMMDSAGEISNDVSYTLEEQESGFLLTVTADAQWLEEDGRVYPVAIDPTIISKKNESGFVGGTAAENSTSQQVDENRMVCGYHPTHGQMEMYFKISNLPTIDAGCTIVDAVVGLCMTYYIPDTEDSSKKMTMEIHQVTESRDGTDWLQNLTWATKPAYNESMDYLTTYGYNYDSLRYWNITRAAKEWYEDPTKNYGLAVSTDQTASTQYRAGFGYQYSSTFVVSYRNTTGIEGYYTYETQSAVRAGTGYVGDYSSALTVQKSDLSFSSTTMPFSLSHVFNSGLRTGNISSSLSGVLAPDYSKMCMGYGWQLSAQESVKRTKISDTTYLVYRDGDGTQHYFTYNSSEGKYYDEDGLGLTITVERSGTDFGYTMKDEDGNKKYFRYGYLTYMEDGNGNRICFVYNGKSYAAGTDWYPTETGSYLTSIVAVNKNVSADNATTICTLTYEDNYLTGIVDSYSRTTVFSYTNGRLTSITHPDGSIMEYVYNGSGQLTDMYDGEAKYGVCYGYSGGGVNWIAEYEQADRSINSWTYGSQINRHKNGIQETVYRYNGDDRAFNTEDDIVTRYAFDFAGRTINATTLNHDETEILGVTAAAYTESSGSSGKNNRVEKDAQSGQAGINLLRSSGLETHDGYSNASSYWTRIGAGNSNNNAVVKQGETVRHGAYALKTYLNTSAAADSDGTKKSGMYQTVTLEAGTYTFSAYANTKDISDFSSGGVYAAFLNTSNGVVAKGDVLAYATTDAIDGGWQRIYVTAELDAGTYRCAVLQQNAYGAAYFDDLQLEKGDAPSTANLLQDGDFAYSRNDENGVTHEREWTDTNLYIYPETDNESNYLGFLWGNTTGMKRGSQTVPINGPATDTYLLSGWAYAYSAADTEAKLTAPESNTKRYFGLIARCNYEDGTKEYFYMPFNDDYVGWQYASCVIAPKKENQSKTLESITIITAYDYNINWAAFDNISLRQEPCTTYTYDSKGNMTAVNATGNSTSGFEYAAGTNKITKSTSQASGTYTYAYEDSRNDHLVTKITNDGVSMNITYDDRGNSTATTLTSGSGRSINTTATYSTDGSQLLTQTNSSGYTTTYTYNTRRLVQSSTDNAGTTTQNEYETGNDRPHQSYISGKAAVVFNYDGGMMTLLERKGYIPGISGKQTQTYSMDYDAFGNMTSIAVGDRTLATYDYGSKNNNLKSMSYGNGLEISYVYDNLDRVRTEQYNGTDKYSYDYNAEGDLVKKTDCVTGETINYEYDSLDRLIHSWQTNGNTILQRTEHLYDTENRITSQSWQMDDTTYSESYTYSTTDGSLTSMTTKRNGSSLAAVSFTYDALKRLSVRQVGSYKQTYTYRNISDSQTTTQVEKIQYTSPSVTLEYTYDNLGNISRVDPTGWDTMEASYGYDELGHLTSETNNSGTYTYTFDAVGNIRSASDGTTTHTYTYGDSSWLDLLTAYDGQAITYDEIGNPLTYYNGKSWNFDWRNGRQLAVAQSGGTTALYTYDAAGIRNSKTVGGITYNYITQNGQVVRQTWNDGSSDHVMDFVYDNNSQPLAMVYDGTTYYYMLNLQGDVIAILDASGNYKAWYVYDAWGNPLIQRNENGTVNLATLNPIRYRGYYYDSESGLYYLGSRYYDPVVKRFLNADTSDIIPASANQIANKNLFSYCNNNPVSQADNGGEWAHIVVGAVVGAAISIASQVIIDKKASISEIDWVDVGASAIGGGLAASGVGLMGQVIGNAALGGVGNVLSQLSGGAKISTINWTNAAVATAGGALSGRIGGAGANVNGAVSKCVKYTSNAIKREARRANQQYATKVLNKIVYPYAKKTLGKIFAVTTARMAMGSTASRYYYKRCVVS